MTPQLSSLNNQWPSHEIYFSLGLKFGINCPSWSQQVRRCPVAIILNLMNKWDLSLRGNPSTLVYHPPPIQWASRSLIDKIVRWGLCHILKWELGDATCVCEIWKSGIMRPEEELESTGRHQIRWDVILLTPAPFSAQIFTPKNTQNLNFFHQKTSKADKI